MKIHITQDDISRGKREDIENCPIALAVKRATACACVTIDDGLGGISTDDHAGTLPKKAVRFMRDFDGGMAVRPFDFSVRWRRA
jgi:hypothetical protein